MNHENTETASDGSLSLFHQPIDGGRIAPFEAYVKKSDVAAHFGVSTRTIEEAMRVGLPHHKFGRLVRFRIAECQGWFEQNGRTRFAERGRRATLRIARARKRRTLDR